MSALSPQPTDKTVLPDLHKLLIDVSSVTELPGNPRIGDVDAVAASLRRFGQRKPIVVRTADRTVIAGNHTLKAAKQLGWTQIAAVVVDDDEPTAKAFALADNRTGDLGSYDDHLLADLISSVADFDEDLLRDSGWHDDAVAELLASIDPVELPVVEDPDDVPERAPAVTNSGDVWLLGPHRVMCGDCTSPHDMAALMGAVRADMVWTDPPYGVSYVGKTDQALTISNDRESNTEALLVAAFDAIIEAAQPGIPIYVAAPAGPAGIPFAVELQRRNMFRQRLVWVKDVLVLGHSDYHYRHEDIYLGYTPGGEGRRGRGGDRWYGTNAETSVLEYPRPKASRDHPTMKPVALIEHCLKNSSKPGDIILDPFGGSGSTMIAAHTTGRTAHLIELDPVYVDVICARWQQATGTTPILEATGTPQDFTVSD